MSAEIKNRIVFTDPGIDDFAAIKYLANSEVFTAEHTVLVPTFGNVPEGQAYRNLLQIHSVLNLNPNHWAISRGPRRPLNPSYASISKKAVYGGHGPNGLWNVATPERKDLPKYPNVIPLHKADLLHISEILSFGPLTGPVILQMGRRDPAKVLIMGGAFKMGNVPRLDEFGNYLEHSNEWVAEFNIFKDALAAKRQFSELAGNRVSLVTMDACLGALVSAKSILEGSYTDSFDSRFMKKLLHSWAIEFGKVEPKFVAWGMMLADLIAVIGYYNPGLLVWEKTGIEVCDKVGPDLGRMYKSKSNAACNVAVAVNDKELNVLMEAVNSTIFGK